MVPIHLRTIAFRSGAIPIELGTIPPDSAMLPLD